ncbi:MULTISPECIES: hypothetical protein [unclassified Sedimentibacter]|uniref:hypothetical protein n=1 Tax=unclassified Sedimentibacter TaxID=2649220 RepID=UPI0027E1E9CB|nr:hypothetical protein [Sedimentibacter sp. MB35-C1]WMJ77947.1 hypothetical protein RBQ61_03185 [Sedimentibacter sp. MB35-C1]
MEQKKNNLFSKLFLNALSNKKNWFFLSTVIIFVTTMLIPFILGSEKEFFIFFGIFEIFVLLFVNCLVDNSFLHNDSKLAYYKSKPASFREQILVNVAINLIFAAYMLLLIVLSVVFQGLDYEILESFKLIIPWLSTGIFLVSLSSILAGNTLVAGAMTIFNFALPGIIYLIIQFMFSILENIVAGFSARVLMNYFVDSFYKLEYIYFAEYADKPVDYIYFLLLGIILVGITLLIFKMLSRRKNENTGNFIVFDGYKYFVSVLACLIVPAFFSFTSLNENIMNAIIVSLLMAALTYYLIIAVIEKSFRVSKLSLKVFAVSMVVFIALTGGTVLFANQYKEAVPEAEDVRAVYIGNSTWAHKEIVKYMEDGELSDSDISDIWKKQYVILFSDKENIQVAIDLHKEILANQNYNKDNSYMSNIVIAYYMNDGKYLVRDYKIQDGADEDNKAKDEIAYRLLNSQELKAKKYFYLYDEKYYSGNKYDIDVEISKYGINSESFSADISIEDIRPYLIEDIDGQIMDVKNSFTAMTDYNYEKDISSKEREYYLEITVEENNNDEDLKPFIYNIELSDDFEKTTEYLNIK